MATKLTIYTDGGSRGNPGPAAAAFIVKDVSENMREKSGKPFDSSQGKLFDHAQGKYLGTATNNEAEYQAIIEALEWILQETKKDGEVSVEFFLDSSLAVNQINGVFRVREARLREYIAKIHELEQGLGSKVTYSHVPREKNVEADALVNKTLDSN